MRTATTEYAVFRPDPKTGKRHLASKHTTTYRLDCEVCHKPAAFSYDDAKKTHRARCREHFNVR